MTDVRTAAKLTAVGLLACVLTTSLLYSVLDGDEWFGRSVAGIGLVFAVGLAARAARIPRPLVLLLQLAATLVYLTSTYAREEAASGWVPNGAAVERLRDLADAAFTEINEVSPPVTPSVPVTFVVVAGVALMAIVVDTLAAGYRLTALAGLPLLVLYVVPAAVLADGVPGILFLLPASGYLLLLITDNRERLMRWGVPVSGRAGAGPAAGEVGRLSTRIGVTVLTMSVAIPALAPRLTDGAFGAGGIGNDPEGGQTISTLNPLVSMRRDLVRPQDIDLMTVTTNSLSGGELYLRTVTLDTFDGVEWRAGRREVQRFEDELPIIPGLPPQVTRFPVESTIEVLPGVVTDYVPMPYPATAVDIDGSWRVDPLTNNVVSHDGPDQLAGKTYSVSSLDLDQTADDVAPALSVDPYLKPYLDLPSDLPDRVGETAERVTRQAGTILEQAIALQQWFQDPANFAYDLRTRPGTGQSAILDFLDDRRGYCEQFASTMAVMARHLGIPARVNVGFTPGSPGAAGTRIISAHDAHAWPELYLPGVGWTRFEPTPGSATSNPDIPDWLRPEPADSPAQPEESDDEDATQVDSEPAPAEPEPQPQPEDQQDRECAEGDEDCTFLPEPAGTDEDSAISAAWLRGIGLGLLVLVLLAVPRIIRAAVRRRRWRLVATTDAVDIAVETAWLELRDSAIDLGYRWPDARTPRQTGQQLSADGKLSRTGAGALGLLVRMLERTRYARTAALAMPGPGDLRDIVDTIRADLRATATARRRRRARWFPPSVSTVLGAALQRMGARLAAGRKAVVESLRIRRA